MELKELIAVPNTAERLKMPAKTKMLLIGRMDKGQII